MAHCNGLIGAGVLSVAEAEKIKAALQIILHRGQADGRYFDEIDSEDVHSFVEAQLVEIVAMLVADCTLAAVATIGCY